MESSKHPLKWWLRYRYEGAVQTATTDPKRPANESILRFLLGMMFNWETYEKLVFQTKKRKNKEELEDIYIRQQGEEVLLTDFMLTYPKLLAEWVERHNEEALRRVTRCAYGNVYRAEDAIQNVLNRMLRNQATYAHRMSRNTDGDIYFGQNPLTIYIVGSACKDVTPPKPQPDQLSDDFDPPAQSEEHDGGLFENLRPVEWFQKANSCLDRLNRDNLMAVADFLERLYPELQQFIRVTVSAKIKCPYEDAKKEWQNRPEGTCRCDQSRGLRKFVECLQERGLGLSL